MMPLLIMEGVLDNIFYFQFLSEIEGSIVALIRCLFSLL